jgi:hypothetical protein
VDVDAAVTQFAETGLALVFKAYPMHESASWFVGVCAMLPVYSGAAKQRFVSFMRP